MTLTFGSLFAGIGGFDLGFERAGMKCVWQVELDDFCRKVLAKHWPDVPKWDDVRTFNGEGFERPDVICGGFPCQDLATAGQKFGLDGSRSRLWEDFIRVVRDLQPRFVVVENVSNLVHRGVERILGELSACGFDAEWEALPASAFGAPYLRDRLWIVAYPTSLGRQGQGIFGEDTNRKPPRSDWETTDAVDAIRRGTVPALCPHARRIPARLARARLRALGNAVVPQVAEFIGRRLMEVARMGELGHKGE